MAEIATFKYIKKKMMGDPNGYSNGRIHIEGMATWKLFNKVEELEGGLKCAFEKIAQLERQVSALSMRKKT